MAESTGGARADGLGALLFTAPGGAYRVEPGGSPRRFREGYVVGATAGRALTLECDASLHCAWTVVELATGDSWSVAAQGDASSSLYNGSALLSPDGAHVVITSPVDPLQPSNRTRFQIYDRNGLVVVFEQDMFATSFCSPLGCGSSAAWSTDGTWLLGLGSSDTMWGWRPGLAAPILAQLPSPSDGHRLLFSGLLVGGPTDGLPV